MPSASDKPTEEMKKDDSVSPEEQMISMLEHKMRNLNRRRMKLEGYKQASKEGKQLHKDQQAAVEKFDEVIHTIEAYKDLHTQFKKFLSDNEGKDLNKGNQVVDSRHDVEKIRDVLKIQYVLNRFGSDDVRTDFKEGKKGAIALTETQLTQLDETFKQVSVTDDEAKPAEIIVTQATKHFVSLLQKKDAVFLNTTYAEVITLINSIYQSDYFSGLASVVAGGPAKQYGSCDQPLDLTMDPSVDPADQSSFFSAPGFVPPQPQPRPISEVIGSGSFSFLQESQIDMESPHMDPAVIAAGPLNPASMMPGYPGGEQYVAQAQQKSMLMENEDVKPHSPVATAPTTSQYLPRVENSNMKMHGAAIPQCNDFGQQIPTQTFTNQNFIKPFRGSSTPSSSVYPQQQQQIDQNVNPVAPMIQSPMTTPPGLIDMSSQIEQADKTKHYMNVNAASFELSYKQATQSNLDTSPPRTQDWAQQEDESTLDFQDSRDDSGDYSQSSSFTFRGFRPPGGHRGGRGTMGNGPRGGGPYRNNYGPATNGYSGGRGGGPGMGGGDRGGYGNRGPSNYRETGSGGYQKDDAYGSSNHNGSRRGTSNGIGPRGGPPSGGAPRGGLRASPSGGHRLPPRGGGGFSRTVSSQS